MVRVWLVNHHTSPLHPSLSPFFVISYILCELCNNNTHESNAHSPLQHRYLILIRNKLPKTQSIGDFGLKVDNLGGASEWAMENHTLVRNISVFPTMMLIIVFFLGVYIEYDCNHSY